MGHSSSTLSHRQRQLSIHSGVAQPDPEAYKKFPPPPYAEQPILSNPDSLLAVNAGDSQASLGRSRSLGNIPGSTSTASDSLLSPTYVARSRSAGRAPEHSVPRPGAILGDVYASAPTASGAPPTLTHPARSRSRRVPEHPLSGPGLVPTISFPMPDIVSPPGGGAGGFISESTFITAGSPMRENSSLNTFPKRRSTEEDLLEMLSTFDTILIIDDSTSMAKDPLNPHSEDRWNMAKEALSGLFEIASRYDTDGVDIHFLNSKKVGKNVRGAREVHRLFDTVKPRGITPIGQKLEKLLLSYLAQIERAHDEDRRLLSEGKEGHNLEAIKPVNFIVLTDGAATDDPESVIVSAARRLDARNFPLSQVGIQFVQIGSDRSATRFLQELDDELTTTHHIRDMVDTTPYSPKNGQLSTRDIIKILVGGINRRIDKKGVPQ